MGLLGCLSQFIIAYAGTIRVLLVLNLKLGVQSSAVDGFHCWWAHAFVNIVVV